MPITSGFVYSCSTDAVGGISSLHIANQGDINANITPSGAGLPPSAVLTKQGTVGFVSITFEDDGCSFTEAVEVSNNRIVYKPEYKVKIGHRTATATGFLDALKGCDRFMIGHIERATNLRWVTGYTATQGMRLISATQQTGNTIADENMIEITFGHPTGVQYPAATVALAFPV